MIEHLRKYSGLSVVVLVTVFISFLFMDTRSCSMGDGAAFKIDGRTYSGKEFQRLGESSLQLASALAQTGDFTIYQFLINLSSGAASQEDASVQFFVNRMLIQQARQKFGIHPGEEEISSTIRSMRAFSGQDGAFNQEAYRNFVQRGMGRMGLGEQDLRDLTSDILVSQKLNKIVGAGLGVDRDTIAKTLALDNQEITAEIARLDLAPYEAKIEPTEEEIKTYWETVQDGFTTEPRRKFTYVVITPAPAEEPVEEKAEPVDPNASEEVKAAAAKDAEAKKAAFAAAKATARRKQNLASNALVDAFMVKLTSQKGQGFEELAKENNWEVKTTDFFPVSAPPKDLDVDLRASSRTAGKAAQNLFNIQITTDPFSKISPALQFGDNQFIVARLDGEEPSRRKTYDEARNDARAQLINEKAAEALKAGANEAVTKIKEGLAAGKSFTDAAKEAGIAEVKTVPKINSFYRADGASEPQNLFPATREIDPGSLAEVIVESDRAFIIYVAKREVVKEENAAARLDTEVNSAVSSNESAAFLAWLKASYDAANVEPLYRSRGR